MKTAANLIIAVALSVFFFIPQTAPSDLVEFHRPPNFDASVGKPHNVPEVNAAEKAKGCVAARHDVLPRYACVVDQDNKRSVITLTALYDNAKDGNWANDVWAVGFIY